MSKRNLKRKIVFSLKFSSPIKDIHSKYELACCEQNITTITPELGENIENLSFLDESRKIHKCMLSKIDLNNKNMCCYWDRHTFKTEPICCPIKYVPSVISRTYFSEITKEKFTVKESITETQEISKEIETSINTNNYYETDGIFCSLNCCIAFIHENRHNPVYLDSESLLYKIQKDMLNVTSKIVPAPHWRMLSEYGGCLDVDSFRNNFSRVEYDYKGSYKPFFKSVAHTFEEKIKF
jgi:hypothetical protein